MTPTAYITVPVTQNPPEDGYYILIDPLYPNLADGFYFLEGDWYETETEARVNENHDTMEVDGCFWLRPVDLSRMLEWAHNNYLPNKPFDNTWFENKRGTPFTTSQLLEKYIESLDK